MPLRKVLLKGMLWSLGFAAAAGVLAVLTQGGDLAWRVVGTGVATALACGCMLGAFPLIDRQKTRSAGLLLMGAITLEFLMGLVLIWELARLLVGRSWEEEIALTMVFFGLGAAVTAGLMGLRAQSYGRIAGTVGIVVTLLAFVLSMISIWIPGRFPVQEDWWETFGAVCLGGGLAVLALVGCGTADRRPWRWAGVVASAIACAMLLIEIWVGVGSDPGFVVFCTLVGLAAVVGHANLSLRCPVTDPQRWVRSGTIVTTILTACMIDLIVIDDRLMSLGMGAEVLVRIAGAAGIAAGCGTLALCILARMNRKVDYEQLSLDLTEMVVVCPRCGKKQSVPLGDSTCAGCKLRIAIRIEEPRCPQCDYLLYGLTSDRCPECGTLISTAGNSEP